VLRRTAREVRRADDDATRDALWRGRLLAAPALTSGGRTVYFGDVTVPREHLPALGRTVREVAARYGLVIVNVGHIGDGNVHPTVIYDPIDPAQYAAARAADDEIVSAALALGGTLTGEHGVGSAKRHQMTKRFSPAEIAAMRAVKRAFDPAGILNPGILLPDPSPEEPLLPRFSATVQASVDAARAGRPGSDGTAASLHYVGDTNVVLDAANLTVTAQPSVSLDVLADELASHGFQTTLPSSDATLEYAIVQAPARAAIRDALLAVRARVAEVNAAAPATYDVRFGSNAVKDVAGYDLKRLFIGSRGVLGQVEEAILRVTPIQQS
ncbi:MAG: FAD-linked oxidase C-terminal domain-containing protein, partial [Dehalococcoidia bacterium]